MPIITVLLCSLLSHSQTPEPSVRESSVPPGNEHEATPTPENVGDGAAADKEPEVKGLNEETTGGGGAVAEGGMEGVKQETEVESGDRGVKDNSVHPDSELHSVPDISVVTETTQPSELSQNSREGEGEGNGDGFGDFVSGGVSQDKTELVDRQTDDEVR